MELKDDAKAECFDLEKQKCDAVCHLKVTISVFSYLFYAVTCLPIGYNISTIMYQHTFVMFHIFEIVAGKL